jgi:hypothetical protein
VRKITGGFQIVAGLLLFGASGLCATIILPELGGNDPRATLVPLAILSLLIILAIIGVYQGWRNMTMSDAEDAARAARRERTQGLRLASNIVGVVGAIAFLYNPIVALTIFGISLLLGMIAWIKEWRRS